MLGLRPGVLKLEGSGLCVERRCTTSKSKQHHASGFLSDHAAGIGPWPACQQRARGALASREFTQRQRRGGQESGSGRAHSMSTRLWGLF